MTELISFVWIALESVCVLLFCNSLLLKRFHRKITWILYPVALLLIFGYTNYVHSSIPVILITALIYTTLSFAYYKGSIFRRLLAIVAGLLLLSTIDTFAIYFWSFIWRITIDEIYAKRNAYLAVVTISKSLSLLIAWLFGVFQLRRTRGSVRKKWVALTLYFPIVSIIMLITVFDGFRTNYGISSKALIFTIALSLGNIGIIYLIQQLEKAEIEYQRVALLQQQTDIQTQSILALEKSYRAQRSSTHDFIHHMNTIQSLLHKADINGTMQYVDQLCEHQTTRIFCINSQHSIIDAIINQKYQIATDRGIDMQIKVNDLSMVDIPNEKLVVLLSNLLDNAIEACEKQSSSKAIRLSIIFDGVTYLTISNTSLPVQIINGQIATSKTDAYNHGYGMLNIAQILKELGAEHIIRYEGGWFYFATEIP